MIFKGFFCQVGEVKVTESRVSTRSSAELGSHIPRRSRKISPWPSTKRASSEGLRTRCRGPGRPQLFPQQRAGSMCCPKLPERWRPQGNGGPGWENENSPSLGKRSEGTLSSSVHHAPAAETKTPRSPRSRALYLCLFLNKRCLSVPMSSLGQARRLQNLRG